MNKVMCSHLLKAYGTTKAVWVGILLTAASHFILKILVPIAATMWIVSITSGTDRPISGIATIAALFVVLMTPLIFDSCITMPKQARLSWTPLFVSGWVT